jgi:hypothetical protein
MKWQSRLEEGHGWACRLTEGVVERTWVGSEANDLGASKTIMVVTLGTNKEGRSIGRGVPPSLETGEVYMLFKEKTG